MEIPCSLLWATQVRAHNGASVAHSRAFFLFVLRNWYSFFSNLISGSMGLFSLLLCLGEFLGLQAFRAFVSGFSLTHRTCGKIKILDEYLTSYKIDFWRSVRKGKKQEHNKNTCDVKCFVFFEVLLIEVVPRNGSGRLSQTDLNWSVWNYLTNTHFSTTVFPLYM